MSRIEQERTEFHSGVVFHEEPTIKTPEGSSMQLRMSRKIISHTQLLGMDVNTSITIMDGIPDQFIAPIFIHFKSIPNTTAYTAGSAGSVYYQDIGGASIIDTVNLYSLMSDNYRRIFHRHVKSVTIDPFDDANFVNKGLYMKGGATPLSGGDHDLEVIIFYITYKAY